MLAAEASAVRVEGRSLSDPVGVDEVRMLERSSDNRRAIGVHIAFQQFNRRTDGAVVNLKLRQVAIPESCAFRGRPAAASPLSNSSRSSFRCRRSRETISAGMVPKCSRGFLLARPSRSMLVLEMYPRGNVGSASSGRDPRENGSGNCRSPQPTQVLAEAGRDRPRSDPRGCPGPQGSVTPCHPSAGPERRVNARSRRLRVPSAARGRDPGGVRVRSGPG